MKIYFTNHKKNKISLEWTGVVTAVFYFILIALKVRAEYLAFILLIFLALLIGSWDISNRYLGILLLQFFYMSLAIIGLIQWC